MSLDPLFFYPLVFVLTFLFTTLFAMGGTGAAIAIIPMLHFLGVPFNLAKATGLFVGFSTTFTASVMNFKRGEIDFRFALPLALSMLLFAPVGAQCSQYVDEYLVKWVFVVFLFVSAMLMLFFKREPKVHIHHHLAVFVVIGSFIGFVAGLLGIGGGNLLLAVLISLGYDPKKVAVTVSFVVPFAVIAAFLSYLSFVQIDWRLLTTAFGAAVLGGYTGNFLMHFKLSQKQVKKVIAIILYLLMVKMVWQLSKT